MFIYIYIVSVFTVGNKWVDVREGMSSFTLSISLKGKEWKKEEIKLIWKLHFPEQIECLQKWELPRNLGLVLLGMRTKFLKTRYKQHRHAIHWKHCSDAIQLNNNKKYSFYIYIKCFPDTKRSNKNPSPPAVFLDILYTQLRKVS